MPEITAVKNALQTVVKKDRILNAVFAGSKSFLGSLGRTFYAFWLQATGLIYLVFTISGMSSLFVLYHKHELGNRKRLIASVGFTLVCLCFTFQSFIKAKRTVKRK